MFKRGQKCPRLFLQKGWDGGSGFSGGNGVSGRGSGREGRGVIGWDFGERGGLQMGRAIPKVYQGYTKTIDISGVQHDI